MLFWNQLQDTCEQLGGPIGKNLLPLRDERLIIRVWPKFVQPEWLLCIPSRPLQRVLVLLR